MGVKDISGKRYGRLNVVEYSHSDQRGKAFWKCECDCGNKAIVSGDKLRRGVTKSCGCLRSEMTSNGLHKTHGLSETRLYAEWLNMRARCNRESASSYQYYGAKGVKVCDEWQRFENFLKWARRSGYDDALTIERISVNGNYSPDNCKWIPMKEQSLNKRNSHRLTAFGQTKTIKEWADDTGLKYDTIERRVNLYGWNVEDAVTVPPYRKRVV